MQKFMSVALLAAVITTGCGTSVGTSAALRVAAKPAAKAVTPLAGHAAAATVSNPDAMEARNIRAAEKSITIETATGAQRALAAAGGVFGSPDGSASVSIPPDALDRDAVIRVLPVDTTAKAVTNAFVPGIAFRLDLGGARILPGKSVLVTSPVDDRFVAAMKLRDPAFTPDAYGLRKDAAGAWQMTMPVHGPALMPVAAPIMPTGWALQEYGSLPAPGSRALMSVDDSPRSSVQDCTTFVNTLGFAIPSDGSEIRAKEADGLFVCDVVHKTDWFSNVADDVNAPRPTCQAGDTPTSPGTPTVGGEPMEVKAVVSLVGKDVLHAKPGAGAMVRFTLLNLAGNGPTEVVANASGDVSTFSLAGQQITAEAYTKEGLHSKPVTFKAVPGMGKVQLVIKLFEGDDVK
ncbi:MAG: hypothetical protein JWM80_40 [Cyanobacteria bacterium RYN_339]|nr:hypothetical protein [Cyanobacteria bacterium RYN_339]